MSSPTPTTQNDEWLKLQALVDDFASEMKARLFQKMQEGYTGWDDEYQILGLLTNASRDVAWLANHAAAGLSATSTTVDLERRKCVDAANRLAMVHLLVSRKATA